MHKCAPKKLLLQARQQRRQCRKLPHPPQVTTSRLSPRPLNSTPLALSLREQRGHPLLLLLPLPVAVRVVVGGLAARLSRLGPRASRLIGSPAAAVVSMEKKRPATLHLLPKHPPPLRSINKHPPQRYSATTATSVAPLLQATLRLCSLAICNEAPANRSLMTLLPLPPLPPLPLPPLVQLNRRIEFITAAMATLSIVRTLPPHSHDSL
mmetsp:Transcript_6866/g.11556  ORF Transcript_6866/g.11556 Transcript_6866/m.11556 type:complete len:209 (+) Transcript_6866:38-664(+)